MKVLLTGGAGYIGFELTQQLLTYPDVERIFIYDSFLRSNYYPLQKLINEPKVEIIRGDILDGDSLEKALKDIDVVYHCAAIVGVPFNNEFSHSFEQTNHWGTASLCSLLENSTVKKLIYLSSGAVYGFSTKPFLPTDAPLPTTSYGNSKLNGEKQLIRLQEKMKVVVLRLGNVFGYSPVMHFESIINKFNLSIALKEPLLVHGNGAQIRPFIHLSRVVEALTYLITPDGDEEIGIHNVYDYNVSLNEILNLYQQMELDFEVIYVNQNQKLNDISLDGNESLHRYINKPQLLKNYLLESLIR